ncbi:hypothetical protein CRG98_000976 [Punica granatum]|uniref:SPX domain-containing protein n=1 Tax=Punica granatum TaxID=22663 RepID=A0A2I0LD37_PUNGR|nr:hypothetical protein CRG98_000976 [Punica granatum]
MVKFSKELEAQLIPEWKEAFVNYWQLKKYVKRIKISMKPKQSHEYPSNNGIMGVLDPIRNLLQKIPGRLWSSSNVVTNIIRQKVKWLLVIQVESN